jgi:hypothetical protein
MGELEKNTRFRRKIGIFVVGVPSLGEEISVKVFTIVTVTIWWPAIIVRRSIVWWTSFRKSGSPRGRTSRSLWIVTVLERRDRRTDVSGIVSTAL